MGDLREGDTRSPCMGDLVRDTRSSCMGDLVWGTGHLVSLGHYCLSDLGRSLGHYCLSDLGRSPPSPRQVHARNLCAQGDPDYDHTCAGAVFLSGGMSCGYVPDVHEVWVCVDPRLTMGECGPARHELVDWQRARPQHQACFTFHESTHQFEYLGDNLSLNLTGNV